MCARLCRRNAQRERERRVRVKHSEDDDAKLVFLSFWGKRLLSARREGEKKKFF